MKSIILHSILAFFIIDKAFGQTETFEGELAGDTTFTVLYNLEDGIDFITTGDLLIEVQSGYGCDGSDSFLGSGTGDGGSSGTFGSIKVADPDEIFMVSTSSPWCVTTGAGDGKQQMTGDIKFIGTLLTGDTIEESFRVVPNWPDNLYDMITFSSEVWKGQELKELEIRMVTDIDYVALDNLVFVNPTTTSASNIHRNEIKIFPNPTTGEIRIMESEDDLDVTIVDALGRIVREISSYNNSIDISELPKGIYYISFYNSNRKITKPIVKI